MSIQKMDVLVALYIFCLISAETLGAKTFPLLQLGSFHFNASVAIFVLPIIFSINDVITEVYGKERARSVAQSGLIMVFLLFVFSLFATLLPPSARFEPKEAAYDSIFLVSARIAVASLIAFGFSQFIDILIFAKLREKLKNRKLWLRNNLSNFLSQLVDTVVFMVLAFYATDQSLSGNVKFLTSLIIPYWLLKCSVSVIETPFVYLGVKWLKKE